MNKLHTHILSKYLYLIVYSIIYTKCIIYIPILDEHKETVLSAAVATTIIINNNNEFIINTKKIIAVVFFAPSFLFIIINVTYY